MSNLYKKIELLANIAIIAVALLLGAVLVNRYLLSDSKQPNIVESSRKIKPGTVLSLAGVEWGKSQRTLLMALSTTCRYCTESAPFYQKLVNERARYPNARVVAVFPQVIEEAQKYLDEHGVKVDEVRQAAPAEIGVSGTPTLILVSPTGVVVESWVGKLPSAKEVEVLNRFLVENADE